MLKKLSMLMLSAFALISVASAQQVVLTGTIGNRTLDSDTCYYLKGCVTVHNGTLTIQPGTRIFGIDTVIGGTSYPGTLIIDTTGYIQARGTRANPIIFTSGKPVGERAAGDWGGIVIAGTARSNQNCDGSPFVIEGPCTPIYAGGGNDADSSGRFSYIQIHYAGRAVVANNELNSLTLCAVGRKTVIDHVQVTNALDDAFEFFGGTVNARYLVAYNTLDDDFDTDFGYRGKVQFGFAWRRDTSKHDISMSHGIESDNNNDGASDYSCGTYQTRAVFSNFTIAGPRMCGGDAVNREFESAIQIRRNSAQKVYNSIITGWPRGLFLADRTTNPITPGFDPTVENTLNQLNFSYNTFSNTGSEDSLVSTSGWSDGCWTNMRAWMGIGSGTGLPPACVESGNEAGVTLTSFKNYCRNYCTIEPGFGLTSIGTDVDGADFSAADLEGFFQPVSYRGAFGTTDWTDAWTDWCPNATDYGCGTAPLKPGTTGVLFVPNPTNGNTYAVFTTEQTGTVRVIVTDKVTGKSLRTATAQVTEAGEQQVAFDASGLNEGVYFVQVVLSNGQVIGGQLSVY